MALVGGPNHHALTTVYGSVFVFRYEQNPPGTGPWSWVEKPKIIASDHTYNDQFGVSVSIDGDVAVVGACNDSNERGTNAGAVYVYSWDGSTWGQEKKLLATDGADGDWFGISVSIDGDMLLVGASNDSNERGTNAGAAYLFRYIEPIPGTGAWLQDYKLLATDGAAGDQFGQPLSISGDLAVVGAPHDEDLGYRSGSVYVYNFSNDSDSDGINNSVDVDPFTSSTDFSDGTTSGSILIVDGVSVEILDAPNPDEGVRVLVSGAPDGIAIIEIDGSVLWYMLEPGEYILTYGSVIVRVVEGEAESVHPDSGFSILVSAGGQAVIRETTSEEGVLLGLIVEAVGDTIIVNDEPVEPGDSVTTILSDSLDIKPDGDPNCINETSNGRLTMAILASSEYDVTSIDESTIRLEDSILPIKSSFEDVNGDTIPDLVVQFLMEDLIGVLVDGAILTITAQTTDGQQISGADVIYFAGGSNCLD
jgi:hypothetical protein